MKNALLLVVSFMLLPIRLVSLNDDSSGCLLVSGKTIRIACDAKEKQVVFTALNLLRKDINTVLSDSVLITHDISSNIIVGTSGQSELIDALGMDFSEIKGKKEAFLLQVLPGNRLLIAGSDKRGTAYGVMEVSRWLGVSPWEWWADAIPARKSELRLPSGLKIIQSPSVEFRGIFINDEDWGFTPWSFLTHEPAAVKGEVGPKTHERVFELLLRLRANTFWPAMHECSVPFYYTKGNKEVAEKYGIYIGTSHCEPMMRNTNGEWRRDGEGEYNFVNNRSGVLSFWEERIKEVSGQDNIYTLGIRGVHDGAMEGAKSIFEQKSVLADVLKEQRKMLQRYVCPDESRVPQVFIPYKEVLDVYDDGLNVPDDVTLVWCDDNYGYIRRFPSEGERSRSGGNGIYYHVSYWGRPHDYLWLATTHPALIYQQMGLAYGRGAQKIWILNVGDIKPSEYQIELFLDMAWDIQRVKGLGVWNHLRNFLQREFGDTLGTQLAPLMEEYYRLAWIRKPEFLANTRVEEKDPEYKTVKDLPWSECQIRSRMAAYQHIADKVEGISSLVSEEKLAAYFQLVKYPVLACAQMNKKILLAQLARHRKADWASSDAAYDSIAALTRIYNGGKWNRIMDAQPRKLPVFDKVRRDTATVPLLLDRPIFRIFDGNDFAEGKASLTEGLGYCGKAVWVKKDDSILFVFRDFQADSLLVKVCLVPTHPVEGETLRFALSFDELPSKIIDYATKGRSEEWKENVLNNRATREVLFSVPKAQCHRLRFRAVDDGVVLDQIILYEKGHEK